MKEGLLKTFTSKVSRGVEWVCEHLDKSNDAEIAVAIVAVFKGILRPIYTLADKKESKESRYYAAAREGLTELIALTSYVGLPLIAKHFIAPKLIKAPGTLENVRNVLSFVTVCGAAVFVIPYLCNLFLPPVMDWIKKRQEAKTGKKLDIKPIDSPYTFNNPVQRPVFNENHSNLQGQDFIRQFMAMRRTSGMRIGS